MKEPLEIVLASESPRRRELFSLITGRFAVVPADVDETGFMSLAAPERCEALAELKCREVAARRPRSVVVGCDTLVEVENETLGKPADRADAFRMLRLLSGRRHSVYTGVAVSLPGGFYKTHCRTEVRFLPVGDGEIAEYIDSGEPFDKAGAYGVQGLAARYIDGIFGDYFNVVGLPVSLVYRILRDGGVI